MGSIIGHKNCQPSYTMYPAISIQSNWNDVLRVPNNQVWISTKYLNKNSTHGNAKAVPTSTDTKLKIETSEEYQCVAYSSLSLAVKHLQSGLKAVFIAPSHTHKLHKKGVLSVSAAESSLVVSACEADSLLVWDSRTSEVLLTLSGHGGPAYKCRFFPSGVVVLSAGADGSCKVWCAKTGINPVTLKGHTMAVTDIAIVERGRNVVSVSKDGTAKLWDVGESKCLDNVAVGKGQINCCCITTTNTEYVVNNEREIGTKDKLLILGCEQGYVIGAHVAKREEIFKVNVGSPCNSCSVIDNTILAGCEDGKIVQLSNDGTVMQTWHESASPILSIAALNDTLVVCGRQDGTCTVFSVNDQYKDTRIYLTGSDCDGIRDIAFNGKWVFSGCRDGLVRKYDINQITVHFK